MKNVLIFICAVMISAVFVWNIMTYFLHRKYPSPDKLRIENGVIYHPVYGKYDEEVEYKPGMTLYPGQTAIVGKE